MGSARISLGLFLTSFEPGGTERQMIELARRLDRDRFRVQFACFRKEGAWLERAAEAGPITEFRVPSFHSTAALAQLRAFAGWCRERRLQVVQAADFYSNVLALPGAALARVPVRIGSRREIAPNRSRAQLALQRVAYAAAHRIVANSAAAVRQLRRELVAPARIVPIPNGIDLGRFGEPAARDGALRHVVTVACLRPEKGHDVLIAAMRRALSAVPDLRLTLVGDGPARAAIAARVEDAGLSDRVTLAGHREDVAAVLREADFFVLPSLSEAFPNSVIEAMAAALPIVASDVGGIPELVTHGRTGILVPPGRDDVLADALVALARDPDSARALGRRARAEVTPRYSFDRMVQAFERLYVSELAVRHRAPAFDASLQGVRS